VALQFVEDPLSQAGFSTLCTGASGWSEEIRAEAPDYLQRALDFAYS
jgi:hypothetical protein